jgi:hypothetical protein
MQICLSPVIFISPSVNDSRKPYLKPVNNLYVERIAHSSKHSYYFCIILCLGFEYSLVIYTRL